MIKNIYTAGKNIWIYFDQVFADTIKFKFSIEEGSTNNEFYIEEIVLFEDCKYVLHKMTLLMLTLIAACNGFQISNLKDKTGKNVFLFDDGSLQAIESSDYFHSRFQIDFIDNNNVVFKNVNGYFLSSDMSWVQMDETFTVEKQEEFVSFKNINSDYLTVSTDGKLSFETTTSPGDQQMFVLSKHCSKGEK